MFQRTPKPPAKTEPKAKRNAEPPLWISLQATLEAHLIGARWAAVAPLVVGHGLDMPLVDIPIVEGVVEAMEAKAAEFWQMVAEGREPEPDYERDGALIDRLYAGGDAEAEVDLTADNRNLQAIHHIIEARRTELRHGTLALVRATFQGFVALPAPAGKRSWREVLNLPVGSPAKSTVEAAYREIAKERHPDAPGGSDAAMAELNAAKAEALREIGAGR